MNKRQQQIMYPGYVGGHGAARASEVRAEVTSMRRNGRSLTCRALGDLKDTTVALPPLGTPRCTCWCERKVLDVTWDEIAEGVTRSCGSPRCDALHAAALGVS